MPAKTSRRPRGASRPSCYARTFGTKGGPPGDPPSCAGWPRWSVRPPPNRLSSKSTCGRCPTTPSAGSGWKRNSRPRARLGGGSRRGSIQALRGVQFPVAVTVIAELGDLSRFDNPRQLMSYLGLTPSEHTSGERRRQGSLTKTGNSHARRALVEGAWAYRYPAKVSRHLQLRLEKVPASRSRPSVGKRRCGSASATAG